MYELIKLLHKVYRSRGFVLVSILTIDLVAVFVTLHALFILIVYIISQWLAATHE